jgi:putative membrane protein
MTPTGKELTGELVPATSRAATGLLAAHVSLILFATLAMVTILAGEFPVWMQGPYTPIVYEYSWRYTGQVYVLLGLAAALTHAAPRFGTRRTFAVFAAAAGIALVSELLGTNTALPFGPYRYTEMLGYRVNGDVPYVIPLSWSYMLYACLGMCGRVFGHDRPWRWALAAGLMLTAWDVPLEVHMTNVSPAHWTWMPEMAPDWLPTWLVTGVFYGMPILNWIGWFATATVIARVMLAVVPPGEWRALVALTSFPLILYAANGVMPIATLARHGLWGAAAAGAVTMGGVLLLASKTRTRRSMPAISFQSR